MLWIQGIGGDLLSEEVLLDVKGLRVHFDTLTGPIEALHNIDLKVMKGEIRGVVGESGCGKSVTSLTAIGLATCKVDEGEILYDGYDTVYRRQDWERRLIRLSTIISYIGALLIIFNVLRIIFDTSAIYDILHGAAMMLFGTLVGSIGNLSMYRHEKEMRRIRGNEISMIFQEPMTALNPLYTVEKQISEVMKEHNHLVDREISYVSRIIRALLTPSTTIISKTKENPISTLIPFAVLSLYFLVISKGASDSFESISWYSLPLIVLIGIFIDVRDNHSKDWNSNDTINSLKAGLFILPNAFAFALILYMMFWMPIAAIMVILIGTFITAITVMVLSDFLKLDSAHSHQVVQILEDVQIPNPGTVATMYPHELSGGMRQRVMIAMMMSCEPNLLIADEPTTALDVTIQAQILKLMREMRDEKGTSIMLITHDLGVIAEMCDTVSVMYAGTVVESGSLEDILTNPRMPYTIGLLHSIPRIIKESDGERKDSLPIIPGQVPSPNEHFDGCRFHPRCPFADEICISTKPENVIIQSGHFAACHHVDKTKNILDVESAFENLASKLMEVN